MQRFSILQQALQEQVRSLIWWCVGIALTAGLYVAIYPAIKDVFAELEDTPAEFLQTLGVEGVADLATPAGCLHVELFSITAPVIFMIFTIARGVGAIAGAERSGDMELLLANPVERSQIVWQRFVAMLASASVLAVIMWATLAVGIPIGVWSELSLWNLTQAMFSLLLVGGAFGGLAFAMSGATGRTGLSYGVVGVLAVATYIINGLAQTVESIEFLQWISPFHYYVGNDPLANGIQVWHALVLLAIIAVGLILAVTTFQRRDLR